MLIKLWNKIPHFGIHVAANAEEQKSIRLTNLLTRVLIPSLLCMMLVVTIIQGSVNPLVYLQPINIATCVFILWLNYKGFINISRFILCVVPPCNIVCFSVLTKIEGLSNTLAFAVMPRVGLAICVLVPVFFFGYGNRKTLLLGLLPSIICFFIFDYVHRLFGIELANLPYSPNDYFLIRASYFVILTVVIPAILTLQQTNLLYEREISQQKDEILAQRDDLDHKSIALQKTLHILDETNQDLTASINYAKRIQTAMLPTEEEIKKGLPNSFVFFKPRDIVSGDFYYFAEIEDKIIIAAVDCTGHGVPGAFMSMLGNEIISEAILAKKQYAPNLILDELHKGIQKTLKQKETRNQDGMDIAMVTLTKDANESSKFATLEYAGAMNPIYIFKQMPNETPTLIEIKADKMPIGGFRLETQTYFTNHSINLLEEPLANFRFYLCSDGYQDQFGGEKGQKFMVRKFRDFLASIQTETMEMQKEKLASKLDFWTQTPSKNYEQVDDILVLGVQVG
jgi:serine phosphatase RsbU (regulator of sigma subunit)